MARRFTLKPHEQTLQAEDVRWSRQQAALAMDEYRAEEAAAAANLADVRIARSFLRRAALAILAALATMLLLGAALAEDRVVPNARVLVAEGVVGAKKAAQPELEDDLQREQGANGTTAGAQPPGDAGVEAQAPPATPPASPPAAEPPQATAGADQVVRVSTRNGRYIWSACAVRLRPGVYIGSRHHFDNSGRPVVQIDGATTEQQARIQRDPREDVAIFTVAGDAVPGGVEVLDGWAAFRAEAVVVAFPDAKDQRVEHRGIIGQFDEVILTADDPGIHDGESGGAVFVDGKLAGIVRGFPAADAGVPREPRVCKFTPIRRMSLSLAAPQPPRAVGATAPSTTAVAGDAIVVLMDVPSTFHCVNCDKFRGVAIDGIEIRERVNDQRGGWPHFHRLMPDGSEQCLGSQSSPETLRRAVGL